MKSPCYRCNNRSPTCHDKCDNYQKWKNQYNQLKEIDKKENGCINWHPIIKRRIRRNKNENSKNCKYAG